jgi:N-acetylmuramoyl-L-alanine amidase
VFACGTAGLSVMLLAGCAGTGESPPDWSAADTVAPAAQHEEVTTNSLPPAVSIAPPPAPEPPPVVTAATTAKPAPPPPSHQAAVTWVPLNQWCAAHGFDKPCATSLDSFPAFALNTTNGSFILRTGSPLAQWNGLDIRLAYAPQLVGDQPFIHSLDLNKTLQPLIAGAPFVSPCTNPVIVIDPGHGGEDAGTRSVLGNGYERDFTLDWARRLAPLLAARGWRVFLTRTNDTHMAISNRIAFAEERKAALFLSLHFNSAGSNERQAGLETYCLTPPGMYSSVTREFGDDPRLTFPNNVFDGQNLQLAFCVHRALLLASGDRDRGVRRARFLGVLRGQNRPAILIEGGYLSNPQEARHISDPAYRQRLAEAVAKALGDLPELAAQQAAPVAVTPQLRAQSSEISSQTPSSP